MELIRLMGLCVLCLLPVAVLRRSVPEQALLLTLAILTVVMARCLAAAAPVLEELRALFDRAGVDTAHVSILLRALAASLVTRLCAGLPGPGLHRGGRRGGGGAAHRAAAAEGCCQSSDGLLRVRRRLWKANGSFF